METVAEENPLRLATSRMVTAAGGNGLREGSAHDVRPDSVLGVRLDVLFDVGRDFAGGGFRAGFESADAMDSLNFSLLLADTTGR